MLLSEWIDMRGFTRAKVAELLETTPAAVSLWYHGKHRPSAAMTARIYDVSGGRVTVADLHRAFQEARE